MSVCDIPRIKKARVSERAYEQERESAHVMTHPHAAGGGGGGAVQKEIPAFAVALFMQKHLFRVDCLEVCWRDARQGY